MMPIAFILLQQGNASPSPKAVNLDAFWYSLQGLLSSFIHQIPYIVLALTVFLPFVIISKLFSRVFLETVARIRFPL